MSMLVRLGKNKNMWWIVTGKRMMMRLTECVKMFRNIYKIRANISASSINLKSLCLFYWDLKKRLLYAAIFRIFHDFCYIAVFKTVSVNKVRNFGIVSRFVVKYLSVKLLFYNYLHVWQFFAKSSSMITQIFEWTVDM